MFANRFLFIIPTPPKNCFIPSYTLTSQRSRPLRHCKIVTFCHSDRSLIVWTVDPPPNLPSDSVDPLPTATRSFMSDAASADTARSFSSALVEVACALPVNTVHVLCVS